MKTGNLTSLILMLLSWITIVHSKCSDNPNSDSWFQKGEKRGFTPICDADGNYEVQQCDLVAGRCFCVERITGVEIDGTSKPAGLDTVDCESVQPPVKEETTSPPVTGATMSPPETQTATPATQTVSTATEDLQLNFDENDLCYKQNKKTYDYWNEKMKSYEEQVQRWQQSMTDYEKYLKSLETDQT